MSRRIRGRHVTAPTTSSSSAGSGGDGFSAGQLATLQSLISSIVQAAAQSGNGAGPTTSASAPAPSEATGKAIFSHVSSTVLQNIRQGEYVDLATLLPAHGGEPQAKRVRVSEEEGQIVLTTASAQSHRKIESITSWLEAWFIYFAVVVSERPDRGPEFVSYQYRIVQAAAKFKWSAVQEYDTSFRQLASRDVDLMWDRVETDLYTRCFTSQSLSWCSTCKKTGHLAPSCNNSAKGSKVSSTAPVCTLFNRGLCHYQVWSISPRLQVLRRGALSCQVHGHVCR